jgi:hypothetical protein
LEPAYMECMDFIFAGNLEKIAIEANILAS